jgi:hypothetical protein
MRIRELFWRVMDRDGCDPRFSVQTYFTVVHFVIPLGPRIVSRALAGAYALRDSDGCHRSIRWPT